MAATAAARAHVERIRRERFYIGREEGNPLADDIHQAVSYLSQELYSKDVHFLMELIQVPIHLHGYTSAALDLYEVFVYLIYSVVEWRIVIESSANGSQVVKAHHPKNILI